MVERAAVNGVIVVRFHAGEPMPGSPSGRGLLSYKQKQWSSILHPGTILVTCAPTGDRREEKKRVGNPLQDGILPYCAPVADGEADGLQSRDWVFDSPPECQVRRARGRVDSGSGLLNRNTLVRFQPGVPNNLGLSRGHQSTAGWPP